MMRISALCLLCLTGLAAAEGMHLFILSGQSNMAQQRPASTFTPHVAAALGADKVIVVHDAEGGQPIRRWLREWTPGEGEPAGEHGDLYRRLMDKVVPAIEGQTLASVTFLWMQGESNATVKHGGWQRYESDVRQLITQLQTDLKRDDLFVVICRISDHVGKSSNAHSAKRFPGWEHIRQVQVQVCADQARWDWISTDAFNGEEHGLHYTKEGRFAFGQAMADKAVEQLKAHGQVP